MAMMRMSSRCVYLCMCLSMLLLCTFYMCLVCVNSLKNTRGNKQYFLESRIALFTQRV